MANWGKRVGKRQGCLIHYDASTSDASGIAWLKSPECKLSYNWAIRDDGTVVTIAPEEARAYHAGACRSSDPRLVYTDANSAFYGVAITAKAGDTVTDAQLAAVVALCKRLFKKNGWPLAETWRITSHSREAWPRGRKSDCEGPDPARPVLDPEVVRQRLST